MDLLQLEPRRQGTDLEGACERRRASSDNPRWRLMALEAPDGTLHYTKGGRSTLRSGARRDRWRESILDGLVSFNVAVLRKASTSFSFQIQVVPVAQSRFSISTPVGSRRLPPLISPFGAG
jgi:hypothetical protein